MKSFCWLAVFVPTVTAQVIDLGQSGILVERAWECDRTEDCSDVEWCDTDAHRCWKRRDIGEGCNRDEKCLSDSCVQGRCDAVACTQDVQTCPDGSFVGREPPSCAFKPCPSGGACTQDVFICPDGSFVGRVPPSCAFQPCASESCWNDRDCPVNYICTISTAGEKGVCTRVNSKLPDGAECSANEQCQSGFCDTNFLEIQTSRTTVLREDNAVANSVITNNPDICRPKKANGLGCDNNVECASNVCGNFECRGCPNNAACPQGRFCDSADRTCKSQLPNDSKCTDNEQCQSGFCDTTLFELNANSRTSRLIDAEDAVANSVITNNPDLCQPKKPLDAQCDTDVECASGLCFDFSCAPKQRPVGGNCGSNSDCTSNVCSCHTNKCITLSGSGGACGHSCECQGGLSCHENHCTSRLPLGSDCDNNDDCLSGSCSCHTGKCIILSGSGGACSRSCECKGGLSCHENKCTSRLPLGADCDNDAECLSGSCSCHTEKCISLGSSGGRCGDSCECQNGMWCHDGFCEAKSGLSGHCHDSDGCIGGLQCDIFSCYWGLCGTQTCVTLNGQGEIGQYCVRDRHCKSNRCRGPTGDRECRSSSRRRGNPDLGW